MIKAAQHCERFLCDMNDNLVGKLTKTLSKAKKKKPRMLGYSSGRPTTKSHFGSVPSLFAMDDVSCFGNETSLLDCPHVTVDNCGSHEAAGVICSNSGPVEAI